MAFVVFVMWPATILAPAAYFFYLYHRDNNEQCFITAILWLAYGVWEYGMSQRVLCTGECNIRIDLILIIFALEKASRKAINIRLDSPKK